MRRSPAETLISLLRSAVTLSPHRSIATASARKRRSSSSDKTVRRLLKNFKSPPPPLSPTISAPPITSPPSVLINSSSSAGGGDVMDLDMDDVSGSRRFRGRFGLSSSSSETSNSVISESSDPYSRARNYTNLVFVRSPTNHHERIVNTWGKLLGPSATSRIFGNLGDENGPKEYNALIKKCMEKARDADDDDVSLNQIYKAYLIFKGMKKAGFKIEEVTYGQFLMYLIDEGLDEEFLFFQELIGDGNPVSLPQLAFYEMLLWIRFKNGEQIQQLCRSIVADYADETYSCLRESLLIPLCESGHKDEFLMLLKTLDITKVSSVTYIDVFRSLGKLLLEPYAERFLLALKRNGIGAEKISNFIFEYASSIPKLAVKDIIIRFQTLHAKFEVLPSGAQYDELIRCCCEFLMVHEALSIVDEAFKSRVALSLETFHAILDACYRSGEFNLVHQINSSIFRHNLKPNDETIRKMKLLYVTLLYKV